MTTSKEGRTLLTLREERTLLTLREGRILLTPLVGNIGWFSGPPNTYLGDHLEAAGTLRGEVCGGGRGGEEGLLAVLLGGEVSHVAQKPVHQLHVTIAEGSQQ